MKRIDIEKLNAEALNTLRLRRHSDADILGMSPESAFKEYCEWHGINRWADTLIDVLDNLRSAAAVAPQGSASDDGTTVARAIATYAQYGPGESAESVVPSTNATHPLANADSDQVQLEKARTLGFESVKAMWDHQSWLEQHGTPEYLAWLATIRKANA